MASNARNATALAGRAPASKTRCFTLRDDIAAVPIEGIDPYRVVVVTRGGDSDPLVADFVKLAQVELTGAQ